MTAETPTKDPLVEWSATFDAQLHRMRALTGNLSREAFNVRPGPDTWSVGQCIDHLAVSMGVYLDPMETAIAKADRKGGPPYGRGTLMGRFLIRSLRKPGARYPAPGAFRPGNGDLDPETVRGRFERQLGRMQSALEECEGIDLGKVKMSWPVFGLIKMTLAQAFELQAIHNERHLDQAERVTREADLPGPTRAES